MKSKCVLMAMLLIAFVMTSCQEEPSLSFVEGNNFQSLYGDTIKLTLKYTPDDAFLDKISWKSSDYGVVSRLTMTNTFAKEQYFIARGTGEANIYAEANIDGEHFTTICQITVREIEMKSLQIDSTECKLIIGNKVALNATYEPSNTSFSKLTWRSSDINVATVNDKGEIKAVGLGECIITVSNERSGLKSQCNVTVLPIDMTSLTLNETKCDIEIGEKLELVASFEPENTTFTDLYWHSSDENIATVENGLVEAIGAGECIISVSNSDNSLIAQCYINVFIIEMTHISCIGNTTKTQGDIFTLSANYEPTNATTYNNALRWHSSNESIATVNELTGEINCVGIGECEITISNIYNSVTASCKLTVKPIPVMDLSFHYYPSKLCVGVSKQCYYKIYPENAYNKEVKWESSNNSVVEVTQNGVVTAIDEGTATITVKALDGSGCIDKCTVKVVNYRDYMNEYTKNYIQVMVEHLSTTRYRYTVLNNGLETINIKTNWNNKQYTVEHGYPVQFEHTNSSGLIWFSLFGLGYMGYDSSKFEQ